MSADQLRRALVRISHEILEQNERPVAIVGLHSRGVERQTKSQLYFISLNFRSSTHHPKTKKNKKNLPLRGRR
ncbi:MAG: hypothetical protein OTJ98_07140, partial [Dehalococcoidia bacterium]|nr:hypothetical protein [Dehalococcoidia bacterium]